MSAISFDKREGHIWFDGKLVEWNDANIHLINQGLHYGSCVFEGERAYKGKIFKSLAHTKRLIRSAEILGMKIGFSEDEIEQAKYKTLEVNNLQNAYIRPVVWKGSETMGLSTSSNRTHIAIACWEWPSYFSKELREKGISMCTSRWRKPAPDTAPTESKAAGLYMISSMAKREAEEKGYDDALMLDYRGNVVEGTGANFFAVKDGVLITPEPDCFLNGITRQTILEIAEKENIPIKINVIKPENLSEMDEIFITGTAAEVTPVGKIDNMTFKVGEITKKLCEEYEKLTGCK